MSYAIRRIIGRERAEATLRELNARLRDGRISDDERRDLREERVRVARVAIDGDDNKAFALWLKGEI